MWRVADISAKVDVLRDLKGAVGQIAWKPCVGNVLRQPSSIGGVRLWQGGEGAGRRRLKRILGWPCIVGNLLRCLVEVRARAAVLVNNIPETAGWRQPDLGVAGSLREDCRTYGFRQRPR
jgi:hypothetical protein